VNGTWYKRSISPAVEEMLMRKPLLSRPSQGELFSQPEAIPELPAEVWQKVTGLLARMLNDYCQRRCPLVKQEVGGE
jgi:hypothetical protein